MLGDDREWLGEIARSILFPTNSDAIEERLIEGAAHLVGRADVRVVAVLDKIECRLQIALQLDELDVSVLKSSFDPAQHGGDCLLFSSIEVGRNDAVEMPIKELPLSSLKPSLLEIEVAFHLHGLAGGARELGKQGRLDVPSELRSERDRPIEIEHLLLDHGDGNGRLRARSPSLVTPAADEVFVRRAVTVLRVLDD